MTMTDPVADLLTRIRNASVAYHESMTVPSSTLKARLAEILVREGYVQAFEVEDTKPQKTLHITMKYGPHRERVITGIKRVSKPGLRVYVKRDEIPRVLGGLGVALISTSNGILTDREARMQGAGGEVLAYIW